MNGWIQITKETFDARQPSAFLRDALAFFRATSVAPESVDLAEAVDVDEAVAAAQQRAGRMKNAYERAWGMAIAGVLGDLVQQGWLLQFRRHHLWGQRPLSGMTRDVLRQRLLIRRDEQLSKDSVRDFVRGMERWRLHRGERTSIVSLMRDGRSPGIIASSMAGRPVGRPANLCFIGTTSLYGRRPNQYDRLSMPAELVGGQVGQKIRYEHIQDETDSRTQGIGTFQFSSKTLKGLEQFVASGKGGWKANNVFGEGTSPKLRGLRDGLMAIGLDADELLVHGIERCMYGVKLARNVDRYLLGIDMAPEWMFDPSEASTARITAWWATRWATSRANRKEVLANVRHEGLAHPIRHRARVKLPECEGGQGVMF